MNHSPKDLPSRRLFFNHLATGVSVAAATRLTAQVSAQDPLSRKRIYIAADDHTDYMWTADEAAYRQAFLKMLDHYLDLADQTDNEPGDYQSRWNCDGLLWFREFQQNRDENEVARLVRRIKSGHISVPMTVLVSCYGGAPTEAVLRGLYYGGQVERKYGLRLRMAVSMENQTLPYGLGMLWAGSGVRYSWKGICSCATKIQSPGNREHDVYWWVGPDGSRILMKWYSLGPKLRNGMYPNEGPGGYAEARDPRLAIEYVDTNPDFRRRNPHSVIGLFGQGWDDLVTRTPLGNSQRSFPVVAKATTNANRRVIVSDENDYFVDMEKTHGKDLPEVKAAYGNEWEIYSASLAEVSASVKRATEKLRAAEAMAAIVAKQKPQFAADLNAMRDQAWIAYGLYWEHDWTADGPISRTRRANWQRKIAKQITDYVDALHRRAVDELGKLINATDSDLVFVFNPLGWKRTDVASFKTFSVEDLEAVDVVTGEAVASQIVRRERRNYLQFLAKDIPACGYKVFRLRPRTEPASKPTITFSNEGNLVSSSHQLRVRADGGIDSWKCMSLGKEVVGSAQVANRIDGGAGKRSVEFSGPISTTIRVDVGGPLARTTRITLYEGIDRIDIENIITQNFGDVRSWRFDFQFDNPKTFHEEVGAILDAAFQRDGGDYADRLSRTDWLTLNHFAAIHDDETTVTLSASDCQFFHLGENTSDSMDSRSSTIHVLAGGQVDGNKLGIQSQGGDNRFLQRFSLRCDKYLGEKSRGDAMRSSLEHQNPLVTGRVTGGVSSQGPLPTDTFSLIDIQSDDVIVWGVKPAEEGIEQGLVVRLWNLAASPSKYALGLNANGNSSEGRLLHRCIGTTHVETDENALEVTDGVVNETILPRSIRTVKCF